MDHTGLAWRKSAGSGTGTNASCVEVACWRKSSHSANGTSGDCVEIACLPFTTAVRDSKNPDAGMLTFPATPWNAFLAGLAPTRD